MTVPSVKDRVMIVIREQQPVHDVNLVPETKLVGDLGFDEIDIVELTVAFEDEFGIDISDTDAIWGTVGECVSYVEHAVRQQ